MEDDNIVMEYLENIYVDVEGKSLADYFYHHSVCILKDFYVHNFGLHYLVFVHYFAEMETKKRRYYHGASKCFVNLKSP